MAGLLFFCQKCYNYEMFHYFCIKTDITKHFETFYKITRHFCCIMHHALCCKCANGPALYN